MAGFWGPFLGGLGAGAIQTAGNLISTYETNRIQEEIAKKNLEYQRENLEYQKTLQQKIFDREDSSYSRTVRDMRQAGLSALNMSGTNQAGQPIQTQALYNDFKKQPYDFTAFAQIVPTLLQSLSTSEEIKRQRLENQMASDTFEERKAGLISENLSKQIESMNSRDKRYFNMKFGINDSMSPDERKAIIFLNMLGVKPTYWKDGKLSTNPKLDLFEEVHPANVTESDVDKVIDKIAGYAEKAVGATLNAGKKGVNDAFDSVTDTAKDVLSNRNKNKKELNLADPDAWKRAGNKIKNGWNSLWN